MEFGHRHLILRYVRLTRLDILPTLARRQHALISYRPITCFLRLLVSWHRQQHNFISSKGPDCLQLLQLENLDWEKEVIHVHDVLSRVAAHSIQKLDELLPHLPQLSLSLDTKSPYP
jgi:hypothetical protein